MKLHDLQPAEGSRKPRTRVGRGIAAGKGKTAGRGTKGQKARAGGSIPAWFEGGQTPLHMRIPKLRGFKNRFKIEYEVVNIGAIGALAEPAPSRSRATPGRRPRRRPITINQDILRAVGLVRTLNKPLKILGAGELSTPLFVVADAFTASARAKIEAAGGTVNVLEVPTTPLAALGVTPDSRGRHDAREPPACADGARRREARQGPEGIEAQGSGRRPPPTSRRGGGCGDARAAPPMPTSRPRPTRQSRRPATTPDPCSNPSSTPSARRTSGAGSSTSSRLLIVFRLLASVPIPGVDKDQLKTFVEGNALVGLLDLFSGGGLSHFSVVGAGDEPVHQRVDHHAADDRRRAVAPGAQPRG